MITFEEQVAQLNKRVLLRVAPSQIHGVGVFALRDIPKGARLYADNRPEVYTLAYLHFDMLRPEVREILLERWPHIINGSNFIYPDTRIQAYMNHADEPNYDAIKDITLRDIACGEEVTEDYRRIEGSDKIFPWLNNVVK